MKSNKKILIALLGAIVVWVVAYIFFRQMPEVAADAESASKMYATYWSLIPPVVAIILALITKEVYSSLFIGIVTGALFYANFNLETAYTTMFTDGFIAKLADSWNVGILIFLVVLGAIVVLMNRAGGSAAYGKWAANKIKGIRAAHVTDTYSSRMTKEHNNANVICLGERITGCDLALDIVASYLDAEFQGGRHQNRIDKLMAFEER